MSNFLLQHPKLVQSYVYSQDNRRCYFISTAYRETSVEFGIGGNYFETMVWEFPIETRKRGKLLDSIDSGSFEEEALESHASICEKYRSLAENDE